MIKLYFRSCDGARWTKTFKYLKNAQRSVWHHLGFAECGSGYAVSSDGIVTVEVQGASLTELIEGSNALGRDIKRKVAGCDVSS